MPNLGKRLLIGRRYITQQKNQGRRHAGDDTYQF